MKIDKFEFSADEYWLCKADDQKVCWPYSLNPRISRDYAGKCDDIGMPRIYLDEQEAEQARQNGFGEISI